ncbi:N-acetylglucosamine-6-phosphate deacetylase [Actinoplanes sp. NBRC 103695]|uniref:N-acetylglucosamine-6-phosphate deacetylase n=1 Tax=Actinoplanes sp. NBRC 103695 TaxID=3032202 RepID=UPI0024A46D22|nr:N-acetylglucosamine-6-phosphate deacetylase [Actinoplanes sp. NBRC 103695]GLY96965.1 N-acetylglucosamine-6-phosphate deacetylase [Actinoplanes sp. NBRC 103695]
MKIPGRIVRPGSIVTGHVEVSGPAIISVDALPVETTDYVVPGFVDLHCHGGGGHSLATGDASSAAEAAAFHLAHGTTTLLASLVSSPLALMREAVAAYQPLVADDVIAGVHFEGPYLSAVRCGAQNTDFLRDPDLSELRELVASGIVRAVTIAPELPGALDAISFLDEAGVVAAIGHTDATYEETLKGVEAGATLGTHLFNGMRPAHHREPGPIIGLLSSRRAVVELIADGVHLHDGMLAFAARTAGPDRTALVTDAIDAAGMPDGTYELGGQTVTVADRVARIGTGSIAGSTLTMDAALRRAVGAGLSLPDACTMASTTPARVLGLSDQVGALAAGLRADLVVLSEDLQVKRVMRAGVWL